MKTNALIALVAVLALVVGVALQQNNVSISAAAPAEPKLEFGFPDMNGQMQSVSQWQGKILLINFWATWCPPCLKEIPEFIQWQQEFQANGVQFVGIALDDRQAVADYLQQVAVNYPILVAGDAGGELANALGNVINTVPFTVIVNRQRQIVHRQLGELSREQFLKTIKPLLVPKTANDR